MDDFLNHTIQELINWRRQLHRLAEKSGDEKKTSKFVQELLRNMNPDVLHVDLGGYGICAIFGNDGPLLLFRAELDALPIHDEINTDYASQTEGVGHKCGHDGHIAVLLALGMWASEQNELGNARLGLLFQPAEETGEGAARVLESGIIEQLKPSGILAFHNLPGYPKHQILVKDGVFAKASTGIVIRLKGRTSHAAHPEDGLSPLKAVIELLSFLEELSATRSKLGDGSLVTVIYSKIGEIAFGTSPGDAVIMATVRAVNTNIMEELSLEIRLEAEKIAEKYSLKSQISETERFEATVNDAKMNSIIAHSASSLDLELHHIEEPFGWSEDFGRFTTVMQGALLGIGAGRKHPQLHHPEYDFPDEIIPTAVSLFVRCFQNWKTQIKQ